MSHSHTCIIRRTDARRHLGSAVKCHLLISLQIKNQSTPTVLRQLSCTLPSNTRSSIFPQFIQPCLSPNLHTSKTRSLVKHDRGNSKHAGSSIPNQASQSILHVCFLHTNHTCAPGVQRSPDNTSLHSFLVNHVLPPERCLLRRVAHEPLWLVAQWSHGHLPRTLRALYHPDAQFVD